MTFLLNLLYLHTVLRLRCRCSGTEKLSYSNRTATMIMIPIRIHNPTFFWPISRRSRRRHDRDSVRTCRPARGEACTRTVTINPACMPRNTTKSVSRIYADVNGKLGPSWHEYGASPSTFPLPIEDTKRTLYGR